MYNMQPMYYPYGCPMPYAMMPQQVPSINTQDLNMWGAAPAPTLPCLNNRNGIISVPKKIPQLHPRILKGRCLDCGKIAQPNAVQCSCGGGKQPNTPAPAKITTVLCDVISGRCYEEGLEEVKRIAKESRISHLELGSVIYKYSSANKEHVMTCAQLCQDLCLWVGEGGGDFKRGLRCVCKEGLGNIMQGVQYRDDSKSECSSSSGYGVVMDKSRMGNVLEFIGQLFLKGLVEAAPVMDCMNSLTELSEEGVSLALELLIPLLRVASPQLTTIQPYHSQLVVINRRLQVLQSDALDY